MKYIIYSLLGLVLALLQTVVKFYYGSVGVSISMILLFAIPLFMLNFKKEAIILWFTGAIVLDFLSPFRLGAYLLSFTLAFAVLRLLLLRSLEIRNPVIIALIYGLVLLVAHFIELLFEPILIVYLLTVVLNIILGIAITIIMLQSIRSRDAIKVSEDVFIR